MRKLCINIHISGDNKFRKRSIEFDMYFKRNEFEIQTGMLLYHYLNPSYPPNLIPHNPAINIQYIIFLILFHGHVVFVIHTLPFAEENLHTILTSNGSWCIGIKG